MSIANQILFLEVRKELRFAKGLLCVTPRGETALVEKNMGKTIHGNMWAKNRKESDNSTRNDQKGKHSLMAHSNKQNILSEEHSKDQDEVVGVAGVS